MLVFTIKTFTNISTYTLPTKSQMHFATMLAMNIVTTAKLYLYIMIKQ